MRLTFHGHAAFSLSAERAPRVLVDPYRPGGLGGRIRLPPIEVPADVVAITHYHEDHSWLGRAQAEAVVADRTGTFAGLPVTAIPAYHDRERGAHMGLVMLLALTIGGLRVVHLGDAGVPITDEQWAALGRPDVLLVPAGGTFTIGPEQAVEVARSSGAAWVVPMHCAHPHVDLPLHPVERFLERWQGPVRHSEGATIDLEPAMRGAETAVVILRAST